MGLLLKIILFGVAIYLAWKTLAHWKGLFDRFLGKPQEPARPAPPPGQERSGSRPTANPPLGGRKVVVEDTVQCAGCGAYISSAAEKCGHCGRPRTA